MVHAAQAAPEGSITDPSTHPPESNAGDTPDTDPSDPVDHDDPAEPSTGDDPADPADPDEPVDPVDPDDADVADPVTEDASPDDASSAWTFEDLALELGSRPTTDPVLRDQLAEAVISLDPEGAAQTREEFGQAWQNLTVTADSSGHMNVDGCVPAEDGVYLAHRIAALIAARVCRRDPRRIGQQRVMALAEITGVPGKTLTCGCGRTDCPHNPTPNGPNDPNGPSDPSDPTGRSGPNRPDTPEVPVDPTEPPDANGYGAEETPSEADAGDTDGPADDAALSADAAPADDSRATEGTAARKDSAPPSPPAWTLLLDPTTTTTEVPRLRGYGAIDPALATKLAHKSTLIPAPTHAQRRRPSGLIIVGDHDPAAPAPPVDPTGHGGYEHPPPGALTYAPSQRLRRQILYTDLTCRYPWCSRPSHDCELDHLVKFHHVDPHAGGWTIDANLAPICTPDHHRKHLGIWLPTMHTDRTITWHNPTTGQDVITHPR